MLEVDDSKPPQISDQSQQQHYLKSNTLKVSKGVADPFNVKKNDVRQDVDRAYFNVGDTKAQGINLDEIGNK